MYENIETVLLSSKFCELCPTFNPRHSHAFNYVLNMQTVTPIVWAPLLYNSESNVHKMSQSGMYFKIYYSGI